MSWVIEHSRHKGSSFVVLLMIANYAHKDGSGAYPGFETLARDSRITIRQVTNIIPILERSGELIVEHKQGPFGTNRYTVNMRQRSLPMEKIAIGKTKAADFQLSVRNQVLEPSPLPPSGGHTEKVSCWDGTITVQMGRRRRLPNLSIYQGGSAQDMAGFLRRNGFECEIEAEELRR